MSASHKAAISRSLKGRSKLGRPANRRTGQASKRIVKRVLGNKKVQATILGVASVAVLNAGIGAAGRRARIVKPAGVTGVRLSTTAAGHFKNIHTANRLLDH